MKQSPSREKLRRQMILFLLAAVPLWLQKLKTFDARLTTHTPQLTPDLKSKLKRFEIIASRDNVLERGKEIYTKIRGNWNELYFRNDKPITIELACGRGEYSVGLAGRFPERN